LAAWLGAERLLRRILEHHAEREIRSAGLLASCYAVALSEESASLSNGQGSPDGGMTFPEEVVKVCIKIGKTIGK
ncbi:MAG: hypothetical protein Q6M04_09185, partial [Thermostichus sp. BF3_bins_97]